MRPRSLLLVAAAALAAAVASPVAPAVQAAPAAPAAAPPTAAAPERAVQLVTGDVVRLSGPASAPTVAVLPRDRHGAAGSFRTFRANGRTSVVPAVALPYVGKQLDPALFDVTTLANAPAGRLPVRIAWAAGATRHAIPGVTVTASSGSTDSGYLTPASARRFGKALADQVRTSGTGLLAGVSSLRYAGAVTPVATPRFPMFTLRIPLVDETGQPAQFASLLIGNTDDLRKYNALAFADSGEVRVSVPEGNYSLLAEFPQFNADGTVTERMVNLSDFAVTGATTLRAIDARTATTAIKLAGTPKPAVVDDASATWARTDETGLTTSYSIGLGDSAFVAPGRPVVHGHLTWNDRWHATAADGSYTYDLLYGADEAVPAVQTYRATAAQLATLTEKYYGDTPQETYSARAGFRSYDTFVFTALLPVQTPTTRTEYVGGSQDVSWSQSLVGFLFFGEVDFIFGDNWFDGVRTLPGGTTRTVEWRRAPLHTSLDYDTDANGFFFCPACRAGDTLGIYLTPLEDTVRGHYGALDAYGDTEAGRIVATTRLRVWRAGTLLTDLTDFTGADVPVPAGDAKFRVLYTQSRQAPWIKYGTRMTTDWSFRSNTPATRTAPADWFCPGTEEAPCAVLPMLTAQYQAPVDLHNTVAPGTGTVRVTLRPTQAAPAVSVDQASVSWSGDDGATWATAAIRPLGDGTFAATVPNPAGATVSLRISGTDRAGNTITQTIIRAYGVRA